MTDRSVLIVLFANAAVFCLAAIPLSIISPVGRTLRLLLVAQVLSDQIAHKLWQQHLSFLYRPERCLTLEHAMISQLLVLTIASLCGTTAECCRSAAIAWRTLKKDSWSEIGASVAADNAWMRFHAAGTPLVLSHPLRRRVVSRETPSV